MVGSSARCSNLRAHVERTELGEVGCPGGWCELGALAPPCFGLLTSEGLRRGGEGRED